MELSPERIAKNDAAFRSANEQILASAREYGITEAIPFLCECADPACSAIIRLQATEFERIRDGGGFFSAPGHAAPHVPPFRVAEQHAAYDVIVKSTM